MNPDKPQQKPYWVVPTTSTRSGRSRKVVYGQPWLYCEGRMFPYRAFRTPCDQCGSLAVLIAYGYGDEEIARRVGRANVALGGCLCSDESPLWSCSACESKSMWRPYGEFRGGRIGPFRELIRRISEADSAAALFELVPDILAFEGGRFRLGFGVCWRRQWKGLQQVGAIPLSDKSPAWPPPIGR